MTTVEKYYNSYRAEVNNAVKYIVKPGDNLSDIAAAEGTTWQKVYASNRGVVGPDPNLIQPGQVLTFKRGKDAKSPEGSTPSGKTSTGKTTGGTTTKAAPKTPTTSGGGGHMRVEAN